MTLTPLDVATGSLFGFDDTVRLSPVRGVSARTALEDHLLTALQRPPCVISFSGGRDSSAVLAVAAMVARREGLPLPVPATLRFPSHPTSREGDWQELVVRHLQLSDWQRLEFDDELDLVGPVAAPVLREVGLQWPFNAYFHEPIFRLAAGGSVLTGAGGDEAFSSGLTWHRENLVLTGRAHVLPLDPVRIAVSVGPRVIRRAFLRLRHPPGRSAPTWLRPAALAQARAKRIDAAGRESLGLGRTLSRSWWPRRSRIAGMAALTALAGRHDVVCSSPLGAERFLGALVAERGWRMFLDRTEATRWLVADLLPDRLTARPDKAFFDSVFFHRHARAFAATWDGSGVNDDYVDPAELRRMWTDPTAAPDARSYTLLQSAWLSAQAVLPERADP